MIIKGEVEGTRGGRGRGIEDDNLERRTWDDDGTLETPASVVEQNWLFFHPLQQRTIDQWLPKGRGNTPRRRTPRGNCHCCHDNVT